MRYHAVRHMAPCPSSCWCADHCKGCKSIWSPSSNTYRACHSEKAACAYLRELYDYVLSITPLVSERWGSDLSWRMPRSRHTAWSSGAPSEYQRLIFSAPMKSCTASLISSAVLDLAGYAIVQPVPRSRDTNAVVPPCRAGELDPFLRTKTESEVTRSPKALGAGTAVSPLDGSDGDSLMLMDRSDFLRFAFSLSLQCLRCTLQWLHALHPGCFGR